MLLSCKLERNKGRDRGPWHAFLPHAQSCVDSAVHAAAQQLLTRSRQGLLVTGRVCAGLGGISGRLSRSSELGIFSKSPLINSGIFTLQIKISETILEAWLVEEARPEEASLQGEGCYLREARAIHAWRWAGKLCYLQVICYLKVNIC